MKTKHATGNVLFTRLRESGLMWEFGPLKDRMTGVGPVRLPATLADGSEAPFTVHAFTRDTHDPDAEAVLLISRGNIATAEEPVVRVHSGCVTGDALGSLRCDCGPQLRAAFSLAAGIDGAGVIYLPGHEGRGHGLFSKLASYIAQEQGLDTYEADRAQGLEPDSRDYASASAVLREMFPAMRRLHLLTNNPEKAEGLEKHGIPVATTVSLVAGRSPHNAAYLDAKARGGHKGLG